jgi:hypothetical protein
MPNSTHDCIPDGAMSPEQEAIARGLSQDFIDRIDAALLAHARITARKVAMIVGLTMMDSELRVPGLPDLFYAARVKALVASGALIAEGNLEYMRYSEVRLP